MKNKFIWIFLALQFSIQYCFSQIPVTFTVDMTGQFITPQGVHIAGEFLYDNATTITFNWDPGAPGSQLTLVSGSIYTITILFPSSSAGLSLQFEFVRSNSWGAPVTDYSEGNPGDPGAHLDNTCAVPDGGGGFNRIIILPACGGSFNAVWNYCGVLTESAHPTLAISPGINICSGSSTLLSSVSDGTVLWTPSIGLSCTACNDPVASPTVSTTYSATAGIAGCYTVDSLQVTVDAAPLLVSTDQTICPGQSYTLPWGISVNAAGIYHDTLHYLTGCDSLIRTVNLASAVAAISNETASICPGQAYTLPWGTMVNSSGTYIDTVRTSFGCDSLIKKVDLIVLPKPILSLSKSNDVNCTLGTSKLKVSGANIYSWSPSSGLNNAFIYNPVASPAQTTLYIVTATTSNGCIAKDSIKVEFVKGPLGTEYPVQSSFTPNNDGLNDCFGVPFWGNVSDFSFSIYDRWGIMVFHTNNSSDCWDGMYRGQPQEIGAYVYQISANGNCGLVDRRGTVMLIR